MADDDLAPREDLSNRYKEVINLQTKSIGNFDDKIWRTMRVTGIISGTGVAVLSYLTSGGREVQALQSVHVQLSLSISILCFIGSFGLGIRSYQSSAFATGPQTEIGDRIKEKQPDIDEYRSTVVGGYVESIKHNKKTIEEKKGRFRLTLASLFLGVWMSTVGFFLALWTPTGLSANVALGTGIISGVVATYITLYFDTIDGGSSDDSFRIDSLRSQGLTLLYSEETEDRQEANREK
ncbi:hypothetical protein HTG_14210 [Natrinema mahii]|nr:hypothetical protein HTG_14210 [Natrinema mahii]